MLCCHFFDMLNKAKGTGHPNVSIVGGSPARAGEFPYMVGYLCNITFQKQNKQCK
jgi:secreted trypsin-like serine protease